MTPSDPEDRSRSYANAPRRRRRFSVWTLLAPAAVIILWISFFSALGKSCVFKECADAKDNGSETADEGDKKNDLPRGANTRVRPGDTMGVIADRFFLSEDELKACNQDVDPQSLQPGDLLVVSAVDCEDADKADVGANPDPLAGDTTAGADGTTAPDPAANGTAAADPSVDAKTESAEQGDEG